MSSDQLFLKIKGNIIERCISQLKLELDTHNALKNQLSDFCDALEENLISHDFGKMDSLLDRWIGSLQPSLYSGHINSLTRLINQIMISTYLECRNKLSSDELVQLQDQLFPIFVQILNKVSSSEVQAGINVAREQLDQSQKDRQEFENRKSSFITITSHELKTPLTLIEGYAGMLRSQIDASHANSPVKDLVEGIIGGTKRLKDVINDLNDVSLIDNGLLLLNKQPVWLNKIFASLHYELEKSFLERDITFSITPFDGFSRTLQNDPERLMQIFRNLLVNAIKFTPDHGKIWVDGRELPSFIEIRIHDTGIGINPEEQTLIFNQFSQPKNSALHSSGKVKFKGGGPGLGLHIVKGILEAMGGTIWAESEGLDEANFPGSTFHILIPTE